MVMLTFTDPGESEQEIAIFEEVGFYSQEETYDHFLSLVPLSPYNT